MLTFSKEPEVAERQMQAIIFYLTTFGYIDGDFDQKEKEFVREYIRKLVDQRVATAMPDAEATLKAELSQRFTTHFHEVFENIDHHVKELFTEAVANNEERDAFVHAKLKLKCFEIFKSFERGGQEELMATVDSFIEADGEVHPAEVKFRAELAALLEADLGIELEESGERRSVEISGEIHLAHEPATHPFFDQFEHHYSSDPDSLAAQLAADRALLDDVIGLYAKQRETGTGLLTGKQSLEEIERGSEFLDGHIYVCKPPPDRAYEITVLGDLHGCYSCLKAAVMQSRFFEKVKAYRADPQNNPFPKLVFLGDYIDRGMFSLNGVLRTVLQMFRTAPEHVYVLRGNHEYYLEYKGQIFGGVKPAEAINTLKPHAPIEVFRHYMKLFDAMPNILFFDRVMFVHAGIPRDRAFKEKFTDLSSLNDPDLRFQMMWSDPSSADVIPAELQEQTARFPFGRLQAARFLKRIGCDTLVRGHEKVDDGFKRTYDDESLLLITLFSAGGKDNDDLPIDSSYRSVTPRAMTMTFKDGRTEVTSWRIEYEAYNSPEHNKFFRAPPQIQHRVD